MCDCHHECSGEWSYNDQSNWPTYRNYYSVYKTPIDINSSNVIIGKNNISIHYSPNQLTHSAPTEKFVQYDCLDDSSYIMYDDKKFKLLQFHFHNSSENTKNNVYYPIECHFVHSYYNEVTLQTDLLVIGILLRVTATDGSSITNNLTENYDKDVVFDLSVYNNLTHNKYYRFDGSLTTPPFDPNVLFNLFFYDDITNGINFNIAQKDYNNYLKYYSNCKANNLSYVNDKRQTPTLSNNFISVKEITP